MVDGIWEETMFKPNNTSLFSYRQSNEKTQEEIYRTKVMISHVQN